MADYITYAPSGVPWIGNLPNKWEIRRIKTILQDRKENNNPIKTTEILSLTMHQGVIPIAEKKGVGGNKPKEDLSSYKLAYPGDIVVNSMNVVAGSVGLSRHFGAVSPVYYMLRPINSQDDVRFFNFVFQSEDFQKSLIGLGNGILVKKSDSSGKLNTIRMRIPMGKLNAEKIPYPSASEQTAIANYLDEKTTQIDSLIEKIERKIELLQEQRTALINQAVTKGLDPNVEMKDSGVEWIGEIPKHWEANRLISVGEFTKGRGITKDNLTDQGKPCVLYSELYTKYERVISQSSSFIDTDLFELSVTVSKGTFLFTSSGETREEIGKCALIDTAYQLAAGGDMILYRLLHPNHFDAHFLSFVFNSHYHQSHKSSNSRGEIVVHIYEKQLRDLRIVYPDVGEQQKISSYLIREEVRTNNIIEKETKRIELLKEYRQSLISNVVTGKVRVVEEVA